MSKLSEPSKDIVNLARRHRLDYNGLRMAVYHARKYLRDNDGIKAPRGAKKLPKLPSDTELRQYFETIDQAENTQHQIMFRILIMTGCRVAELVKIKVEDVDLGASKIFIDQGKGSKDRYVLFGEKFRLVLQMYMGTMHKRQVYLFESTQNKTSYSTRRIEQLAKMYMKKSMISANMNPHMFRHILLTYLTKKGLGDSQIQLISGHASKAALEKYQHLSLGEVGPDYQHAIAQLPVD